MTALSLLAAAGGLAVLTSAPATAGATSVTFTDSSTGHEWTVPQGVSSITVDALGGSGNTVPGSNGGAGAHVVATIAVTPGATLHVHVAGNGSVPAGGANGGGAGSSGFGGGGGASDVRTGADTLASRILVAGGGGGQGFFADGGAAGQAGGGDVDPPFIIPAAPGSQTAGGAGGVWISSSGQSGTLGNGGDNTAGGSDTSSGGGGGYYGGGGGAVFGSGAGGSNLIPSGATQVSQTLGSLGAAPYVSISWTTPPATSISVSSLSLAANGTSTGTVTATVSDQYGQRVPGDTVTFTASDPGVTFGSVTDNHDGTYSATVTSSTTGGAVTITAHDGATTGTGTLTQTSRSQLITFTSTDPSPASIGGTYTPAATASSGLIVTFTVAGRCTLATDGSVKFTGAGTCTVTAHQSGNSSYDAATPVDLPITIAKDPTVVAFAAGTPTAQVVGQSATLSAVPGASSGDTTFSLGTGTTPGACTVSSGGAATFDHVGSCVVDLDQAGDEDHDAATTVQHTTTIAAATTSTTLSVGPNSISATVGAVPPGAGTPSGTVDFYVGGSPVGSSDLVAGVATLAYAVPSDQDQSLSATYRGVTDYATSSASLSRVDPTITAAVTSTGTKNAAGWYRDPVTVTFTCASSGAALTGPCPAPVVLDDQGAGQTVSATIHAVDGGAATATVTGINIDRTAPLVSVRGVRDGGTYAGTSPKPRCVASDALSGIASCTITTTRAASTVSYEAVATDNAGNTSTASGSYKMLRFTVQGVPYSHGAFQVSTKKAYTVVALASGKRAPRYLFAAPRSRKHPGPGGVRMKRAGTSHGLARWTQGIHIDRGMGAHDYWYVGVKTGGKVHRILLHVHG